MVAQGPVPARPRARVPRPRPRRGRRAQARYALAGRRHDEDVMEEAVDLVRVAARRPRHAPHGRACRSPPLPPVCCDPTLLRIVLVNLLDNAVKYGDEGGDIRVKAEVGLDEQGADRLRSASGTAGRASTPPSRTSSSAASRGWTTRPSRAAGAPASASTTPGASSSCTADASAPTPGRASGPSSVSRSRLRRIAASLQLSTRGSKLMTAVVETRRIHRRGRHRPGDEAAAPRTPRGCARSSPRRAS